MRVLAKQIEVIVVTDSNGDMNPIRFKAKTKQDEDIIIGVDRVLSKEMEKFAGNNMLLYKCRGIVNDKERDFELKFEFKSLKWMLWKM